MVVPSSLLFVVIVMSVWFSVLFLEWLHTESNRREAA